MHASLGCQRLYVCLSCPFLVESVSSARGMAPRRGGSGGGGVEATAGSGLRTWKVISDVSVGVPAAWPELLRSARWVGTATP